MKKINLIIKVNDEQNREEIMGAYKDYKKAYNVMNTLLKLNNNYFGYYVRVLNILD